MTDDTTVGLLGLATPIAQAFLHTIVVLDDEITHSSGSRPQEGERLVQPGFDNGKTKDAANSSRPSHTLNAKILTESFAKLGLICSILVPTHPDEELTDEVRASARRADVVILDWTVHNKKGDLAKKLTRLILDDDSGDERLRLLAIYTAEPDLDGIASDVGATLEVAAVGQVVQKGSARIRVFGKGDYPADQLPDAIVSEFAEMIVGLLPMTAVSGMARLRNDTYKLIGRFNHQLDPAYLGHRILTPTPAEAEQHLEAVLASEILAIIEYAGTARVADIASIRVWLTEKQSQLPQLAATLKPKSKDDQNNLTSYAGDLLEGGLETQKDRHEISGSQATRSKLTEAFTADSEEALTANHAFAALMSLKHSYGTSPRLWLGSVIAEEKKEGTDYWLCIQPRCDSTNLKSDTTFPFLRLLAMEKPRDYGSAVCVIKDRSKFQILRISKRASDLRLLTCTPGLTHDVIAEQNGDVYQFATADGMFRWVCELKTEHAQRAINAFSAWTARVGVTDSEWLTRYEPE